MPIYEYVCEQCAHEMEAIQRLADPPLTECSKCGGRLRKKLSAPAFQFKGSGWYVTDYARKGGESGSHSKESSDSGGDDSSAGPAKKADKSDKSEKSESKPEPAAPAKDAKS